MKPSEAIKILEHSLVTREICYTSDYFDACKLGIEAIELNLELRKLPGREDSFRLPGETKD